MQTKQKKILVVDDDPNFRLLLSEIFNANGYDIIEARTAREGIEAIDSSIGLAIVDYRLPDRDGMSFISELRESGKKFAIVFISGTFIDAKTFNWLRNILNVSLVLQKPIQPNYFIQQLEGLLPVKVKQEAAVIAEQELEKASAKPVIEESDYEKLLMAAAGIKSDSTFVFESEPDTTGDTSFSKEQDGDLFSNIEQMRQKLKVEAKIRAAQSELRQSIPAQWHELSTLIATLQQNENDPKAHKESIDIAHRLRGTAGSLGLSRVSISVGKLEDYLRILDPSDAEEHELLWGEIFRALADGELGLTDSTDTHDSNHENVLRTLLLADEKTWTEALINAPADTEFVYAASPTDAVLKASSNKFDVGIIDLAACSKSQLTHLVKALRATPNHNNLPLACLKNEWEAVDSIDAAYIGLTETMEQPLEQVEVSRTVQRLARARQLHEPRILTVDDDSVLTRFIQTILRTEGMNVSALNEPINILSALEESEPELVLLDVMMPGLSGYDLCRWLRQQEKWKNVTIIFLTSKSDAQGRAAAFQAGANDFLSKPILSEELITRVKDQLALSNPQRQSSILDDITGLLKREVFWSRLQQLAETSQNTSEQLTLSFIAIDDFDEIGRYGLFVELAVVAALGKLLNVRFKSEVLRGRWDKSILALAVPAEDPQIIEECLRIFAREAQQIPFSGELGERFDIGLSTITTSFPADGENLELLAEAAVGQLFKSRQKQTGGQFTS